MTRQLKTHLLVMMLLLPQLAQADPVLLVQRVEGFLLDLIDASYPEAVEVNLTVRPPDTRLALDDCTDPQLTLHGANEIRGRVLVRAECSETFVLHLAANIEVKQRVVVTSGPVTRQTLLSEEQLSFETVNILSNNRRYLTEMSQATGKVLTRSVRTGTELTAGMLKKPDIVSRGDSVVIIASRGELVVRMPGVAMATGGMNEQINVRNESSDRIVKGWIKGPGEVHVPF